MIADTELLYVHTQCFVVPFLSYIMQACSGAGEWRAALSILDDMQAEGLRPESAAYIAAMEACARGGVMDRALELLDRVLQDHPGDEAVISLFAKGVFGSLTVGRCCACLAFHEQLGQRVVYVACTKTGFSAITCREGSVVPLVFFSLIVYFLQTITAGYRGAIRATANGGQWEEATSLLQRMRQDSLAVVKSEDYNAAILACVRAQQPVAALTLLGDMSLETKSCRADETSYILVMRAFGREGR